MIFGEGDSTAGIAEYTDTEKTVGERGHDETCVCSWRQVGEIE